MFINLITTITGEMFLKKVAQNKSNKFSFKKFFFLSYLTIGLIYNPKIICQPIVNQNSGKESKISNISFITKAIKKTGASVVTIDTQRLVKNKEFSSDSRIFIDPYFERFFGLRLPRESQPRIEQSQGSGFIFADGLVITNAHVVNGSEKLIVGLSNGKKYKDVKPLRYGKIMMMTDQDVDGSHIKGLLFNLFNTMWPSLIIQTGFMNSMLTPIVKAKKKNIVHEFYNLTDYENWKKQKEEKKVIGKWDIKYYKGLGTSTEKEAKEYFRNLKNVEYIWNEKDSKENFIICKYLR